MKYEEAVGCIRVYTKKEDPIGTNKSGEPLMEIFDLTYTGDFQVEYIPETSGDSRWGTQPVTIKIFIKCLILLFSVSNF